MLLLFQMLQVHTLYCLFRNNKKKEERKRQKNKKNRAHYHYCVIKVKNVPGFIATDDDK